MNQDIVRAEARYVRMSPIKLRRVINLVRKKDPLYALGVLDNLPQKGARLIYKVLKSAVSNAVNKGMDLNSLHIAEAFVNEGPKFKRYRARARGRAFSIEKKMSHICFYLGGNLNSTTVLEGEV